MPPGEVARISYAGREAEELFTQLVACTLPSKVPSRGDVRVVVDDAVHYVEVKTCGAAAGGNVNQVRAIKYLTLAVYTPQRALPWLVLPANVVVARVAERARGQHSEVAFENATVALGAWATGYACSPVELSDRVVQAIHEAERYPELRRSMALLLYDLKRLGYRARDEVRQILAGSRPTYWEDP